MFGAEHTLSVEQGNYFLIQFWWSVLSRALKDIDRQFIAEIQTLTRFGKTSMFAEAMLGE